MLASLDPVAPVYCVHPGRLATAADEFLTGFPGRVLYAIKANNDPVVLDALYAAGIRHFDCASLREIEAVTPKYPDATSYFMSPVRFPGDAGAAFNDHGVRHFMVDSVAAVAALVREIDTDRCVIFARMAVSHELRRPLTAQTRCPESVLTSTPRTSRQSISFEIVSMVPSIRRTWSTVPTTATVATPV